MDKLNKCWTSSCVLSFMLCILLAGTSVFAQPGNEDEKPENLKVLPKDMTLREVRGVMFGFTQALGVRCGHCHEGEMGEHDFASDEKPIKDVARAMMKMVMDINENHIGTLPDAHTRLAVTCATCHHGITKPQPLENLLADFLPAHSVEETVTRYQELKDQYYGGDSYDFQEPTLVRLGQRLIADDKAEDALTFLNLNAELFPESSQTYSAISSAYVKVGNKQAAVENLQKAYDLNPNPRLQRQLDELKNSQ